MPSLDEVVKDVNKKFKENVVSRGVVYEDITRIPFSSPRVNYSLYGGLPIGRIVEFAGPEGGGKTTSALDVVANAQRLFPERKVVYIDIERTFDGEWAAKLGVDVDNLYLFSPDSQTAEEIFDATEQLIATGEVSVCVIDSLGVMVSSQAYTKSIEEKTYGGISQSLTLFSKRIIPICARTGCLLIGINQVRDDMNSTYGGTTTTGGRAWRHNCSVRLEFAQSDFIDEAGNSVSRSVENPAGHNIKFKVVKSKVCRLDRKIGFYTLRYLTGIDYISDTIDVAVKENIIAKSGAWFSIIDENTGELMVKDNIPLKFQGKAKLHEFLENNRDIYDLVYEQISVMFS